MTSMSVPDESNAQSDGANNASFRQLVRTLNASGNAVTRKTADSDSETAGLLLENASIRLCSRMLSAITQGACLRHDSRTIGGGNGTCPLDDQSIHLQDLTDMLSHAASRLEQMAASADPGKAIDTPDMARMRSLEHLYRMTFAISKAHFDPSQSGVYFQAAREQLVLARNSIQTESNLCACSSKGYAGRLRELSEVDQLLKEIQTNDTRP